MIRTAKVKGGWLYDCHKCGHFDVFNSRQWTVCPVCHHKTPDTIRTHVRYHWARRSCGYSRLFPPEDIKRAMQSVYAARIKGVSFDIKHTFAGMRVTVTSLKLNKKVKDADYWDRI